jgi:hypothetical protein
MLLRSTYMTSTQRPLRFTVVVALIAALALVSGFSQPVRAASEDVAMFYDDLSQYGQWVDYDKYGPVWRPSQVPEDWRPYANGRWVPTNDGYVFESDEPWGWATYHYGNWMPTEGYGWVWVPGRTWYPSTVEWRTSPESEPVDSSYIGWAPIPPPDYAPPPSYAPPSYYSGSPVTDALFAPLWIFVKAASFLLGFGQPYAPDYSYMYSGFLVPPAYVPVFYPRTVIVQRYFTPTYYPPTFYGGRRGFFGAYSWGPPVPYISRVTRINQTIINRTIINNSARITRIRNVVPPRAVMNRYRYLNQIVPPALAQGRRLPPPQPVRDIRQARVHLNRPNLLAPPRNVPRVTAQIPRVQPAVVRPGHGIPGTALPPRATMHLTPQMQRQIQQLPPNRRIVPAKPLPIKPAMATQPGPARRGVQTRPGQVQPGRFQPGTEQAHRGAPTRPGSPAAAPARPGEFHPGAARPGTAPQGRTATPRATRPSAPLPPGYRGLTQEQRRQQEIEHQRRQRGGVPGQAQTQQLQRQPRQQQVQQQQRRQQQDRQRQQQLQQQQRQQQMRQQRQRQPQDRQRQQQIQQQQQRQRQMQLQQQQRRRQQQIQPQQQRQRQQIQPQPQRRPQPQQIQRQPQQQPQQRQQPQRRQQRKKPEHEPQ